MSERKRERKREQTHKWSRRSHTVATRFHKHKQIERGHEFENERYSDCEKKPLQKENESKTRKRERETDRERGKEKCEDQPAPKRMRTNLLIDAQRWNKWATTQTQRVSLKTEKESEKERNEERNLGKKRGRERERKVVR